MRRLSPLLALMVCLLAAAGCAHRVAESSVPWRLRLLPRTEIPAGANALERWRPLFPRLFPERLAVIEQLQEQSLPLEDPSTRSIAELKTWLAPLEPVLAELTLRENERFQLPVLIGPETPFPDHQPLLQLATVRLAWLKVAWTDGRRDEALAAAVENLRLARAFLNAQEGLVPLIQATRAWQLSLDGVYWLARQDALTPGAAARLQAELSDDRPLAADALVRAFRGEFTFFTHLVVERLPRTHDVNLLLDGIASLGMTPPEPPAEGEPRLATPARDPFDREATLQAAADDIGGWIDAFAGGRHPRDLHARHTGARLQAYADELGAFLLYASEDSPPTPERINSSNTIVATVENPVGKLFLVITTSHWEPVSAHVFRREAQRAALTGLLAWRRQGTPAPWEKLVAAGLLAGAPADPFADGALRFDTDPVNPRIWSAGANGIDDGGAGSGENPGSPRDLTWPAR